MTTKKRNSVIGRGLSSLLESPETDITSKSDIAGKYVVGSITHIPVSQIEANPFQPRDNFDEDALNELAESIKLHGVIQPVTLRKLGYDKYQLIAGERRLKASIIAGLTEIPAFIRIADDEQMLEWALIENIHRANLNPIEIALSYRRLIDECNLTQDQLSVKVQLQRSTVTNYLRLLKLPDYIQKSVKDDQISMGHARAIAAIDDPNKQKSIFEKIVEYELSVREVEKLVKSDFKPLPKNEKKTFVVPGKIYDLSKNLAKHYHAPVKINYNEKGKGSIIISFHSEDELLKLIDKLS